MKNKFDVIIIGGGIIGALTAYELSKQNKKVLLLEKHAFGYGASGNSAAMLESQLDSHRGEPFLSLALASAQLFPSLYQEILNLTGIDFEYEKCGIMQVASTKEEENFLKQQIENQNKIGLKTEWFAPEDLASKYPELAFRGLGAVFYLDDGQVNGDKFLIAAIKAAEMKGAVCVDNCPVDDLLTKSGKICGVRTSQGSFYADSIVLALGAWADDILNQLGLESKIEPIRGQLIVYDTPGRFFPFPVYTTKDGYITPKKEGATLAGTTVEQAGFESVTTTKGEEKITGHTKFLFPSLIQYPIKKSTAGLRPKSPGELPLIGLVPGYPNVFLGAGHFRNGILLAPITAKILSSLIQNEKPPVNFDAFMPEKFLCKT